MQKASAFAQNIAILNNHNSLVGGGRDYRNDRSGFVLTDTGLSRDFNAFVDALLASKDVVVATNSGTITMLRIDVKDAKRVRH